MTRSSPAARTDFLKAVVWIDKLVNSLPAAGGSVELNLGSYALGSGDGAAYDVRSMPDPEAR